jgi:hypothetical protein
MSRAPSHRQPRPAPVPITPDLAAKMLTDQMKDPELAGRVIDAAVFWKERAKFFNDSVEASKQVHRMLRSLQRVQLTSPSEIEDAELRAAVAHYLKEPELLRRAFIAHHRIRQAIPVLKAVAEALQIWNQVLPAQMLDGRLLLHPVTIAAAFAAEVATSGRFTLKPRHLVLVSVAAKLEGEILTEDDHLLRLDRWKKRVKSVRSAQQVFAKLRA